MASRHDMTEPLPPEELDDDSWAELLERVEEAAERRHVSERDCLIAAGVVDTQGRLCKPLAEASPDGDEGGW